MFPVSESKRSAASQSWCVRGQSVTPLASFEQVELPLYVQASGTFAMETNRLSPLQLIFWKHHHPTAAILRPQGKWQVSFEGMFLLSPPLPNTVLLLSFFSFYFRDASHSSPALFRSKIFPRRDMDSWRVPRALSAITSLCSLWDDSPTYITDCYITP